MTSAPDPSRALMARYAVQTALFGAWGYLGWKVCALVTEASAGGQTTWAEAREISQPWFIGSALILLWVLLCPNQLEDSALFGASKEYRALQLGLVGAFCVALPAVVITILAFVITLPGHFTSMNDNGCEWKIDLNESPSSLAAASGKFVFILGLDLSESFFPPGNQVRRERILKPLELMMTAFISADRQYSIVAQDEDLRMHFFAGDTRAPTVIGNTSDRRGYETAESRIGEFLEPGEKRTKLAVERTNLVSALHAVLRDASDQARSDEVRHVAVIFLSDLHHDVHGTESSDFWGIIQRWQNDLGPKKEKITILSGWAPPLGVAGSDHRKSFQKAADTFPNWRHTSLEELGTSDPAEARSSLARNLFRVSPASVSAIAHRSASEPEAANQHGDPGYEERAVATPGVGDANLLLMGYQYSPRFDAEPCRVELDGLAAHSAFSLALSRRVVGAGPPPALYVGEERCHLMFERPECSGARTAGDSPSPALKLAVATESDRRSEGVLELTLFSQRVVRTIAIAAVPKSPLPVVTAFDYGIKLMAFVIVVLAVTGANITPICVKLIRRICQKIARI